MPTNTVTLDQLLAGIRKQETGGTANPYQTVNGIGASGAYQVMPANIPSWTKQALGHSLTQQQFLASPTAQDAVARTIIGGYYAKYGAEGAAAMWYSGQPNPNSQASSPGAPTVRQYVNQVIAKSTGSVGDSGATAATAGLSIPGIPSASDVAGDIFGSIWQDTKPLIYTGLAVAGGLALVVAGMIVTASPQTQKVRDQAQQAASVAMLAA